MKASVIFLNQHDIRQVSAVPMLRERPRDASRSPRREARVARASASKNSDDRRPHELAVLEPLGEQTEPRTVPGQDLQIIAALATEDEHGPGSAFNTCATSADRP